MNKLGTIKYLNEGEKKKKKKRKRDTAVKF